MMRQFWSGVLFFGTLGVAGVFSADASASQCVMFGDVAEGFAQRDVVFVGIVTGNRQTGEIGHHVLSDVGTFRVVRAWKGRPPREVDVLADAPFVVGKRYVVFASVEGKALATSIECDWTQLEENAHDKLEWLKRRFPN